MAFTAHHGAFNHPSPPSNNPLCPRSQGRGPSNAADEHLGDLAAAGSEVCSGGDVRVCVCVQVVNTISDSVRFLVCYVLARRRCGGWARFRAACT